MATDGYAALTTERTVVASPLPPQHPWPGGDRLGQTPVRHRTEACTGTTASVPTTPTDTRPAARLAAGPTLGVPFAHRLQSRSGCTSPASMWGRATAGCAASTCGAPAGPPRRCVLLAPPPPGAEYLSSFALPFLWGMLCFGECGFIYLLCRVQHQFAAVQFSYEFLPVAVICQFSDLLGIHSTGVFNFCDPTSLFVFFTTSEIQNEVCES